jgi:hypothetical protein
VGFDAHCRWGRKERSLASPSERRVLILNGPAEFLFGSQAFWT